MIDGVFAGHVDSHAMATRVRVRIVEAFDLNEMAPRYLDLWRRAIEDWVPGSARTS